MTGPRASTAGPTDPKFLRVRKCEDARERGVAQACRWGLRRTRVARVRLVLLSDTHGFEIAVPEGDAIVHAGDFSRRGKKKEVERFAAWLGSLPHRHKIVIAGNHDFLFQEEPAVARSILAPFTYLEDAAAEIDGVRFWGSPWQPWFHDWAFNLPRGEALREKWDLVPTGTHVLVTHGPPHGILDRVFDGRAVGCEELVVRARAVAPLLHVFGHIHEAYGVKREGPTLYVNAANCNLGYQPVHPVVVVDVDPERGTAEIAG